MQPQTKSLLDELERAEWFYAVGLQTDKDVIGVSSWDEAVNFCSTSAWANFKQDHANRLTVYLSRTARERYQEWNDIVRKIKARTEPLVESKLDPLVLEFGLARAVDDDVRWDVLHACMELEYADLRPPAFYAELMEWYLKGRFPCGWGARDARGRIRLAEVEADLGPNEPDYLYKAAMWPVHSLTAPDKELPPGKLIIY